jgi:hypothetical protein
MNFLQSLAGELVAPFFIALAFMSPLVAVAVALARKKRAYKEKAHEPFTQLPLRPPGESTRLKIESLNEEFGSDLMAIALGSFGALSIAMITPKQPQPLVAGFSFAFTIGIAWWFGRKLCKTVELIWRYRLGFSGERAVAEELNQLLASGYKVFHDVPFDRFNIDHVIVGATGVYVVETKTRRKPSNIRGTDKATVEARGDLLEFPNGQNTEAVPQARLNAKTLGEWLTKATAERVAASAIVTLPGWWVNRRQTHDVNVLNPEEIKYSFPKHSKYPLTPEQIQRIAHQLTERCRLAKDAI